MASLNKVMLIGNLGKDPEIRSMQDGREIANLTLATSESWKDKNTGERKEKSEWHKIVIFNSNLVTVAKNYLKKGSKVYIEGSLQTRKWTDKDGADKYSTEIVLQNFGGTIVMLDGKKAADDTAANTNSDVDAAYARAENSLTGAMPLDDEIPF